MTVLEKDKWEVAQIYPGGTINVVHLPSEMLYDALYFKEVAESLPKDSSHDFERWRYLRASIIFSFIAIESYINEFIKKSLERGKKLTPSAKEFLENERRSIWEKLTLGVELITGKEVDTSSFEYKNFKRLGSTRNKLIHFRGQRGIYTRDITTERAEEAIETVRKIIKKIHEVDGTPYPQFVDTKQSKSHVISSITII